MRKRHLFAALVLVSCGSPPAAQNSPAPSAAPVPSTAASASPASVPQAPLDPGLPAGALMIASLDVGPLFSVVPGGSLEAAMEQVTGVKGVSMASLGIDPARPVTIAMMGLDDAEREKLHQAMALPRQPGFGAAFAKMVSQTGGERAFRVVVPSVGTDKTIAALGAALASTGLKKAADGAYTMRHVRVELGDAKDSVVLDVGMSTEADARAAIDTLHAAVARGHAAPPALEGRAVRAIYSPAQLDEFETASRAISVAGAISGGSVDDSQRDRIIAEWLNEARDAAKITSPFSSVEISGRAQGQNGSIEARGELASSVPDPAAAAWLARPSVVVPGAKGTMSIAPALAAAFAFPGEIAGQPLAASPLVSPMRDNPFYMGLSFLPAVPAVLFRVLAKGQPGLVPGAAEKFERTGYYLSETDEPIFVGLLPQDASLATAECALTPSKDCPSRLKLDVTKELEKGSFARLTHVAGSRALAIVIGPDKARVASQKLTAAVAPPFEISLPHRFKMGSDPTDVPGLGPDAHIRGEIAHEGRTIVLRVSTP